MDAVKKKFDEVHGSVDEFKCKIITKMKQDGQEVEQAFGKVIVVVGLP